VFFASSVIFFNWDDKLGDFSSCCSIGVNFSFCCSIGVNFSFWCSVGIDFSFSLLNFFEAFSDETSRSDFSEEN